jgi:hypothetical protein
MKGMNEIRMAVKAYCEEEYAEDNRFNHTFSVQLWEKGGERRAYINRTNGRNNKCVGWVDLDTLKLHDFSDWKLEEKIQAALA